MTSPDKTLRDSETPIKTAYPKLLNALAEMQGAVVYAARRGVLAEAEVTIIYIERELNAANAEIADLKAKLATARDELREYYRVLFQISEGVFDAQSLAKETVEKPTPLDAIMSDPIKKLSSLNIKSEDLK